MLIDVVIEDERWTAAGLAGLAEIAAGAALAHLGVDATPFEISLLGCNDMRIAGLNGDFRAKPHPTNVLSWPSQERGADVDGQRPDLPGQGADPSLGDIAIAYETCAREAGAASISFDNHVTHLIVHGALHLLGYDHTRDQDATLMQATEVEILGKLGVPDPY